MSWYTLKGQTVLVKVRVQPKAAQCKLETRADGRLKLRLTAPPVDGLANKQAAGIIAKLFAVPKSRVTITAGAKARDKTFAISGIVDRAALPDPETLPGSIDKL